MDVTANQAVAFGVVNCMCAGDGMCEERRKRRLKMEGAVEEGKENTCLSLL